MTLLVQILTTLALVVGIILGESIATAAFGTFKKTWFYLVEICLFVFVLVLIFNTVSLTDYSDLHVMLLNMMTGFLTIIFVRGVMSGLGIFSEHIEKKVIRKKDDTDYVIGLKKALEHRGFGSEEIQKVARETGFSQSAINKVLNYFEIKSGSQEKNVKKPGRKTY